VQVVRNAGRKMVEIDDADGRIGLFRGDEARGLDPNAAG